MNKKELADAVSDQLGTSTTAATKAVDAVLNAIQDTVAKGEKVALTGFGSFEKQDRAAREARNPATGATIQVPAKSVPTFKAGADFKATVARGPKVSAGS